MVDGGMKCVKYLLFIFNVIFVIAAISLITTGALVQTRFNDYFDFFGTKFNGAAILLIVVGVVMFVIAFFGCCGAIRENYVCTMVFAALLIVVFVLEMAGGIAGFVMRTSLRAEVSDIMMAAEVNYGKAGYNGVTETWDKVQEDFKCCGVNSPADWQNNARFLNSSVPDSCCRVVATRCGTIYPTFTGNIYPAGCLNATAGFLKENIYFVGAAGIGLAFVQIAGVIFACCLARSIKKEKGSS